MNAHLLAVRKDHAMSRTPLVIGAVLLAGVAASSPLRRAGHALLLRTTGTVIRDERPSGNGGRGHAR